MNEITAERKRHLTLAFVGFGLAIVAIVLGAVGVLTHFIALVVVAGLVGVASIAVGEFRRRSKQRKPF